MTPFVLNLGLLVQNVNIDKLIYCDPCLGVINQPHELHPKFKRRLSMATGGEIIKDFIDQYEIEYVFGNPGDN